MDHSECLSRRHDPSRPFYTSVINHSFTRSSATHRDCELTRVFLCLGPGTFAIVAREPRWSVLHYGEANQALHYPA
ncbi:hypothetical protein E2C01_050285 [Portunus trituberculatus]|uniref:Uncharacterized protein n=1 Tax=Portunus trituberculatus TaxID=210409 RepID=A0A5B7G7U9_PORTR|nr:hypothetical protein [Portunus trituberculatus]